ncbi:hypothetical protein, partial [Mesorhizobium sp.]|uniref:hypothetical protein n=1 Tax=Mesorhizobium sp. TaxID=1871066 RepID=UPI0025804B74
LCSLPILKSLAANGVIQPLHSQFIAVLRRRQFFTQSSDVVKILMVGKRGCYWGTIGANQMTAIRRIVAIRNADD